MLRLALVLPLLFASPETIIPSKPEPVQSVSIVPKVTVCIDTSSWQFGYCIVLTAGVVEVTLLLIDGSPISLKLWNGVHTHTIWERYEYEK